MLINILHQVYWRSQAELFLAISFHPQYLSQFELGIFQKLKQDNVFYPKPFLKSITKNRGRIKLIMLREDRVASLNVLVCLYFISFQNV